MLTRLEYGAFTPDLGPSSTGLDVADNVYAIPNGYRPVRAFSPFTPALPESFAGGAAFVSSQGLAALLTGTSNKLLRYSGGAWSILLTALSANRWRFSQFGDNVIAVFGGAPQKVDLIGGNASQLGGDPPAADMVATVRDFVVLAGDPSDILTVTWSGFNDSEQWTSGVAQSDNQPMLSGGEVMGLAGGEYGIILQRQRIVRMSYTGGDTVFQFDEIASNVGCMAKGSVAQVGQLVFFLSERGFQVCDGSAVRSIGAEKIDRTFFARYSREDIQDIHAAVDPRNTIVLWSMPGTPGTIWAYNWTLERWSTVTIDLAGVFTGFTANVSLDAIDALYPGGLDTVPYSLDDPIFAGGSPLLFAVNDQDVVGTLTGDTLPARFTLADREPIAGRFSRVRTARAVSDAVAGGVTIDARRRAGDVEFVRSGGNVRGSGDIPLRITGRHMAVTHTIPAGERWTYAQGLDLALEPAGAR